MSRRTETIGERPLAIFGGGGFGLEVAMLVEHINDARLRWKLIGFFDDGIASGTMVNGYPVIGGSRALGEWASELSVVIAVGNPKTKVEILDRIHNPHLQFPVLMHPSVICGREEFVQIGEGSIVCAGTILTTNITVGRHVILNLACTVGHQTEIGDFSSFMPTCNISGEVKIGRKNYWGTGAKVINGVTTSDRVTVGAGAVVTRDLPEGATAVGVPAKVIRVEKI